MWLIGRLRNGRFWFDCLARGWGWGRHRRLLGILGESFSFLWSPRQSLNWPFEASRTFKLIPEASKSQIQSKWLIQLVWGTVLVILMACGSFLKPLKDFKDPETAHKCLMELPKGPESILRACNGSGTSRKSEISSWASQGDAKKAQKAFLKTQMIQGPSKKLETC